MALADLSRQFIFPGCRVAFPGTEMLEREHPGATLIGVRTEDGIDLSAARIPSAKKGARTIVFFHGNGESAAQNIPFGIELAERGFHVVLAEYRGYGGMPGVPSEEGVYRDAVAVIAAAGAPASELVLVGRSLGTGVAVEMASRGIGARLVLVSPFTSIAEVASRFLGPLAAMVITDRFDSAAKIARVKIPIIVLHGDRDEVVPFALGEKLAKMAQAKFVPIRGHGHNDLFDLADQIAAELAD